jgi:hypothetical protein
VRADDIIDQIDSCLGDYQLSPDAMRWTPEPAEADRPGIRGFTPTVEIVGEVGEWRQGECVVVIVDTTALTAQFEQLRQVMQAFGEAARARMEEIGRAFDSLKQAGVCDDHGRRLPPRDRPAWQSRYGPAHQSRRR